MERNVLVVSFAVAVFGLFAGRASMRDATGTGAPEGKEVTALPLRLPAPDHAVRVGADGKAER